MIVHPAGRFDRHPGVVASYVRVEYLTAQPAGVGTRWRQTRRVFDREHTQELSVVAWEPPAFLVTVAHEAGATYRTTWRLVPDDGGTMTTLRFEIGATNVFGTLVQRMLGGRLSASTRDAMERDLADLARAAEQAKGGCVPRSNKSGKAGLWRRAPGSSLDAASDEASARAA